MAGRFLGLLINLLILPIAAAAIGYILFDKLNQFVNGIDTMPMDAINTMVWLKLIFVAGIFLTVLALGWNHINQSQTEMDLVS